MRPRVIMVLAIATIVLGAALLVPAALGTFSGGNGPLGLNLAGTRPTPPPPSAPPPPSLRPASVQVPVDGFLSWALLDRATGEISGSPNRTATNSTESMIKVWLVSDYLRRLGDKQPPAERLKQASRAIRNSDDKAAESLFNAGGRGPVIDRLIDMCGLTATKKAKPPGKSYIGWAYTQISAPDAARLGDCVASGKAAGPKWTPWVLEEMTKVEGSTAAKDQQRTSGGGRWGIIDGLPKSILDQGPVSIKNGWTLINADGLWHLNCLAVTDEWSLAVLMRYPGKAGLKYGATTCATVTSQLVTPQPGAALKVPQPLGKA
ncbi:hypothetical protein [Plantactinospora sp. GCM10030261]|uniref:hypothetical protein n=1 Tax=Plantactinospora sp. GCM10030261 TaxID=3273420 RepID=UPI00360865DC